MAARGFVSKQSRENNEKRKRLDTIIRYLEQHRGANTARTILQRTGINLDEDDTLRLSLQLNPKTQCSGNTYKYKPNIEGINGRPDLCRYLERHLCGVEERDLRDAYYGAGPDIDALVESNRIVAFQNTSDNRTILFWYPGLLNLPDDNLEEFPVVEKKIVQLWDEVDIPRETKELENQLKRNGLLDAQMSRKRKLKQSLFNPQRKKRRTISVSKLKLTNTHLIADIEQHEKPK